MYETKSLSYKLPQGLGGLKPKPPVSTGRVSKETSRAPIIGDPARPAAANDVTFPMAIVAEEADEYLGQLSASSGAALAANAAPIAPDMASGVPLRGTEGPAACYYRVEVDGVLVFVIAGKNY